MQMQSKMHVTQAANGEQAFFRTNNGGYGTQWQSTDNGEQVRDPNEVPQFKELVSHPRCPRLRVNDLGRARSGAEKLSENVQALGAEADAGARRT